MIRRGMQCTAMFLLAACGEQAPDPLTKDEARERGGKADDGEDACELLGWYGDGVCDDFCARPDPDCPCEKEVVTCPADLDRLIRECTFLTATEAPEGSDWDAFLSCVTSNPAGYRELACETPPADPAHWCYESERFLTDYLISACRGALQSTYGLCRTAPPLMRCPPGEVLTYLADDDCIDGYECVPP